MKKVASQISNARRQIAVGNTAPFIASEFQNVDATESYFRVDRDAGGVMAGLWIDDDRIII